MGRTAIRTRGRPVEALRTGISTADLAAALAAMPLDALSDVTLTDPQDDDVLTRSGSGWINAAPSGGGGVATIHNYFPDGAISSDALIDLAGEQDYVEHVWQGNQGSEVLTLVPTPNRVRVQITAWDEGVAAADWENTYGCGLIPAGFYTVGVTLSCNRRTPIRIAPYPNYSFVKYLDERTVTLDSNERRFLLGIRTTQVTAIGFTFQMKQEDYPDGASAQPTSVYVHDVMITEGDPSLFCDGDSSGWTWTGTANASASSGPQP